MKGNALPVLFYEPLYFIHIYPNTKPRKINGSWVADIFQGLCATLNMMMRMAGRRMGKKKGDTNFLLYSH